MENELLESSNPHAVVVRPAWEVYGHPWHPSFRGIAIGDLIRLAKRFRRGKYIGSGENCYSSVYQADLADLYCLALKKFRDGEISPGASENFSMKELAAAIHQGFGFKGEPSSLSLEDARRFSPIADSLIQSHALSSDLAKRTLGWKPSHDSILKGIEHEAFLEARVSKQRLAAECKA